MPETPRTRLLLIGVGAQAKYVLEICHRNRVEVAAVMSWDANTDFPFVTAYGAPSLPYDKSLAAINDVAATHFIVCCPDAPRKREHDQAAVDAGLKPFISIHPGATIASTATVSDGAIINAGAIIQPFVRIGRGVMIHAGVIVEHDCEIGDYANLAPGARLAGWCNIGEGATVFTGASLIPSIKVGAHAVVAAGAVVTKDVEPGWLVAGVPAKPVKRLGNAESRQA
ncbi:MAG TPA: NeuD/PglB/VioB family sugar acetyltransferase [Rhizobiaceae bacterium]|nr:NeuD/PglB/VioB family sugar acetyltransferase [Rhizobiaceae bacterium]